MNLVKCDAVTKMPTDYGLFTAYSFTSLLDEVQHIALVWGDVKDKKRVLVRMHSECLTGDVFSSKRCDCGQQLHLSLKKIVQEECGILVYLRGHEGRGIGLKHKLQAYSLQDAGLDTVEANEKLGLPIDSREYQVGRDILINLGVTSVRLLTNNPAKYKDLSARGLEIAERVPLIVEPTVENAKYLRVKEQKMGHLFSSK